MTGVLTATIGIMYPSPNDLTVKIRNINSGTLVSEVMQVMVTNKKEPTFTVKTPAAARKSIDDPDLTSESLTVILTPNPARNILTVYPKGFELNKRLTITLSAVSGSILKTVHTKSKQAIQIDLSTLAPGVYFLKMISGRKELFTRFVKL